MAKWVRGLRGKLLLMGLVPLLILGIISYVTLTTIDELNNRLGLAYNVRAKLIESAGEMDANIHALGRWMWITYGLEGQIEARDQFIQRSLLEIEHFETVKREYVKLPRNPKIKEMFVTIEQEWPGARNGAEEAIVLFKKHTLQDNELAKQVMQKKLLPHLVLITKTMTEIKKEMRRLLAGEIENADSFARATKRNVIFSIIISVIACFSIAGFLSTNLARKFSKASESLHEVSVGVYEAAVRITASSQDLSQSAIEQAASIEETASSLEEISSMIAKSATSSETTSSSSAESRSAAELGQNSVQKMMKAMGEIRNSNEEILSEVHQSNQQMSGIIKIIEEIGEKTKVINEIVFQTKLLSFNASVEAARAGEQGKGFAVVADEVGQLAQMSGNAAQEISSLLSESIERVSAIVKETKAKVENLVDQSKHKVDSGVEIAKLCSENLAKIVDNISKVATLSNEISLATREQATGVAEINTAMSQMNIVTEKNSTASVEVAETAKSLSAQADTLKQVVEELVQTVDGRVDKNAHSIEQQDLSALTRLDTLERNS